MEVVRCGEDLLLALIMVPVDSVTPYKVVFSLLPYKIDFKNELLCTVRLIFNFGMIGLFKFSWHWINWSGFN